MVRWINVAKYVGCATVTLYGGLYVYSRATCAKYQITQDLSNRSFLITGASAGIGLEAAKQLAAHGATVHMLCRNEQKADKVAQDIKKETENNNVHVWTLDTSKFSSVRNFATKFLATKQPIDVLINNAGIYGAVQRQESQDGHELTMATNHFGHFLLTNLLLERVKESDHPRIVNVSSGAYRSAKLTLENYDLDEKSYNSDTVYSNSKLANILFTKELALRLKDTDITVNALHPGVVITDIFKAFPSYVQAIIVPFYPLFKKANEGAVSTLYLATSPEVEGKTGLYFSDCKPAQAKKADDKKFAKDFWDLSEKVTGLNFSSDAIPTV